LATQEVEENVNKMSDEEKLSALEELTKRVNPSEENESNLEI